jgi:hypothetical protein
LPKRQNSAPTSSIFMNIADAQRGRRAQGAAEFITQQQQGKGRPTVAGKIADHQVVAVGNASTIAATMNCVR